ncbi:lysophospholipid acyltransferase family protein [Rufibacter roseus]|uniref:Lysophospholipid acyltransferase family protein n=1 Tax=Rufibacter roseus TaxID=1567108 RepID=A0ABW2DN89_9BACT|nr:lysophospholipid acyltransferase family protein [Rufibacter roseus]
MSRPNLRPIQLPLWWLLKGISLLPFPVLYVFSDFLYLVVYRVVGYRKKVVRQNLERAFPGKTISERRAIEKQFFRNLADIIVETLKLVSLTPEELAKRVTLKNRETIDSYLEQGKPVMALGAHLGNWEFMSAAGNAMFPYPIDGVYKPLASPFFEAFMYHLRSRFGITLVPMKETLRHMLRHRGQTRILTLLSDQVPPFKLIQFWTNFLHQDTPFYVGAEKMRTSFGYPTFFAGMRHVGRGYYEVEFQELLPPPVDGENIDHFPLTEAFARKLEVWIEQNPADYLWSHKRWKHQRPQ